MVASVVATGIVVAGGDVVVGDAVEVVGTVVVVAVCFGEEAPDLRRVLILGLTVVAVVTLTGRVEVVAVAMGRVEVGRVEVGRVEVGRVEVGRVEVGRVVVVRAEGARVDLGRVDVGRVVVVRADVPPFDIFRSGLILVVVVVVVVLVVVIVVVVLVVVVVVVVRAPVADVPARYRRRVDPFSLGRRCVLVRLCLVVNMPRVVDRFVAVVGASVVVTVVDGAPVPAAPGWSAAACFLGPCRPVERVVVVVVRSTVVELLGMLGAGVGGGGTLVPKEAASAPRAIFRSTTSVVTTICRSTRSLKKVSANLSNCSRWAPTLPGCARPRRGLSSATSRRPVCTVMSPWRTPSTTAQAIVRASFSGMESARSGLLRTSSESAAAAWLRVVPELAITPDSAKPRKTATRATAVAVPIRGPRPSGSLIYSFSRLAG